jgi:hypothetical protein|nr:hypothetical protein [uncultured Acetatifactor sp.]
MMLQGQMNLLDFSGEIQESEMRQKSTIDFSCFSTFRSEAGGVRYGECIGGHCCEACEVYRVFYGKADEYQRAGNRWGKSVALAREYLGVPTVPEYSVEAYL